MARSRHRPRNVPVTFDLAWNYRATLGYVTDPSYACFNDGNSADYPHTYTNGDGYSINAGWTVAPNFGSVDRDATNDPRLAGLVDLWMGGGAASANFRVDLSSGSAPGAASYTVDLALGDANTSKLNYFKLFDNATTKIDGTNGGSGFATAGDHYIDATLADVGATTTWTGATAAVSFASTTVNLTLNPDLAEPANHTALAHFRLTLQAGGGTAYTLTADTGAFTLNLNPIQPVANVRTTTFALTGFPAALRWSAAGGGLTAYHHHYGG